MVKIKAIKIFGHAVFLASNEYAFINSYTSFAEYPFIIPKSTNSKNLKLTFLLVRIEFLFTMVEKLNRIKKTSKILEEDQIFKKFFENEKLKGKQPTFLNKDHRKYFRVFC